MTTKRALTSNGQPEEALDSLPTAELAARCARKIRHFLARQPLIVRLRRNHRLRANYGR